MKLAFEAAIKPLNTRLAENLGIKNIKVKHYKSEQPVTVQSKEDGIVANCNHAGAEFMSVHDEYLHGDLATGEVTMREESVMGYSCDKCLAFSCDGIEWNS